MAGIAAIRKARWDPLQLTSTLLIKWWMLLRTILVSTTMIVVCFLVSSEHAALGSIIISLSVSVVTALVSFLFYRAVKRSNPPELHYYLQYFFDFCLITLITVVSRAADVNFTPLYVMSITVASILSVRAGAYFAASVASLFYLPIGLGVVSMDFSAGRLPALDFIYVGDRLMLVNVGLQVFLFYCLALTTSYLAHRLRRTGWELEDTRNMLRQYRLDTEKILENIASALLTCNCAGIIIYANPAAVKILGLGLERLINRSAPGLFSEICPEIAGIVKRALESQVLARRQQVELVQENLKLPLVVSSSLLFDKTGALSGVSLVFEDVTHEVKARELELRSGKLEAVAELSAGLAHEIKNPLSSIRSAVELLCETAGDAGGADPQRSRLMSCIITESDRLNKLLKQFLQFSSSSFGPTEAVELGPVFEEVLETACNHADWREDIEVEVSAEVAAMQVIGHRDALSQVFFNLIINSAQVRGSHGEQVGKIKVEPCREILKNRAPQGAEAASYHGLCLADDGPGIPLELREKVFEPFFSGRKSGFGLGLAVVHRIIHALGGAVYVDESPWNERGAAFFIALPRRIRRQPQGDRRP